MEIPVDYEVPYYYKPILKCGSKQLLNMMICFSQFEDDERAFLTELAKVMGATVNNYLVKSEKPLLICTEALGQKYQAAIQWGIPIIQFEKFKQNSL